MIMQAQHFTFSRLRAALLLAALGIVAFLSLFSFSSEDRMGHEQGISLVIDSRKDC